MAGEADAFGFMAYGFIIISMSVLAICVICLIHGECTECDRKQAEGERRREMRRAVAVSKRRISKDYYLRYNKKCISG